MEILINCTSLKPKLVLPAFLLQAVRVPKASCSPVRGSDCRHSTLNCAVLDSLLGHSCHQEKSKLAYPQLVYSAVCTSGENVARVGATGGCGSSYGTETVKCLHILLVSWQLSNMEDLSHLEEIDSCMVGKMRFSFVDFADYFKNSIREPTICLFNRVRESGQLQSKPRRSICGQQETCTKLKYAAWCSDFCESIIRLQSSLNRGVPFCIELNLNISIVSYYIEIWNSETLPHHSPPLLACIQCYRPSNNIQ